MFRFINTIVFKDIESNVNKNLVTIQSAASAVILLTIIVGVFLTGRHGIRYYQTIRDDFLAEDNGELPAAPGPFSAVWFTREDGDPTLIQGIIPYFESYQDGVLSLSIINVNDIPVTLLSVQDSSGKLVRDFEGQPTLQPDPGYSSGPFTIEGVDERMLENRAEILVNYTYDGKAVKQVGVVPFKRVDDDLYNGTAIRTQDNTDEFDFIQERADHLFFSVDIATINTPLFIPPGKPLRVFPGQEINLINNAFIFARTPVEILGTASNPAIVRTSDATGQGIYVEKAGDLSLIDHAYFEGLGEPQSGIWHLTGAITFYESDVEITNSTFTGNTGEDGLNIIRSDFRITDSYFADTASDAFDADFCTGEIINSTFENTTNDAVDVSGSQVSIKDTDMTGIGDKAVSAGENSRVTLESIAIDKAVIGIASKDLTHVSGDGITLSNSMIGLTLYIKKPEFGPATMDLQDVQFEGNVDLEYLIQKPSALTIDGRVIQPRSVAKERLLFEKMINGEPIQ